MMTVVQRLELARRIGMVIENDGVELGTGGRQLRLQLGEFLGGNDTARELIVRDYHANRQPPSRVQVQTTFAELDALSDDELLDLPALAAVFGYPAAAEAQNSAVTRGAIGCWPISPDCSSPMPICRCGHSEHCRACWRPTSATYERWRASAPAVWARHVREGLIQLAESAIADRLA